MACVATFDIPIQLDCITPPVVCKAELLNLPVDERDINCCMITGTVTCSSDDGPVQFPTVVAKNIITNATFFAIGDQSGNYSLLVPEGATYEVLAICNRCCPKGSPRTDD